MGRFLGSRIELDFLASIWRRCRTVHDAVRIWVVDTPSERERPKRLAAEMSPEAVRRMTRALLRPADDPVQEATVPGSPFPMLVAPRASLTPDDQGPAELAAWRAGVKAIPEKAEAWRVEARAARVKLGKKVLEALGPEDAPRYTDAMLAVKRTDLGFLIGLYATPASFFTAVLPELDRRAVDYGSLFETLTKWGIAALLNGKVHAAFVARAAEPGFAAFLADLEGRKPFGGEGGAPKDCGTPPWGEIAGTYYGIPVQRRGKSGTRGRTPRQLFVRGVAERYGREEQDVLRMIREHRPK